MPLYAKQIYFDAAAMWELERAFVFSQFCLANLDLWYDQLHLPEWERRKEKING